VAPMKPLEKLKDTALDTIKHPLGSTQKVVGLAVGTARGTAQGVMGGVTGLLPGRKSSTAEPGESTRPGAERRAAERKVHGDPVRPKASARKASASKKAAAAKKAPPSARKAAAPAPRTAAEVAAEEGPGVTTPVGTTGADLATNPDTTETDLQQPGTEPLMDPSTVKAARSEAEMMQKGAETDKS
jgi:hypothetical protein